MDDLAVRSAVDGPRDEPGGLGPDPAAGVVGHRGDDGDIVAVGDEPLDEALPALLRGTHLRGVVMGQQEDAHATSPTVMRVIVPDPRTRPRTTGTGPSNT